MLIRSIYGLLVIGYWLLANYVKVIVGGKTHPFIPIAFQSVAWPSYACSHTCSSYRRNTWATCPAGYFLNGLYRTSGDNLHNIEKGKCCKPLNHPESYEACYNEYVRYDFDKRGWTTCKKTGYYIVGIFRDNFKDWLHNIDYFKCCKMWTGISDFSVCYMLSIRSRSTVEPSIAGFSLSQIRTFLHWCRQIEGKLGAYNCIQMKLIKQNMHK